MTTSAMSRQAPGRKAKILFVDDETSITTALRRMVAHEPFDVRVANTVTEALEVLATDDVDVVVSDESMPGMSGSDFLAQVRREHPDAVRMLLTGNGNFEVAIHAVNHGGIFRFLRKPCSAREVIESLRDAVEHRYERLTPVPPAPEDGRAEREARFESAVSQLWMAQQPVVYVARREVFGVECLVRSDDPSIPHGGAFVELAASLDRSVDLDRHIRLHVAAMLDRDAPAGAVLVNLHPSSLDDPDLFDPRSPLSRHASSVVLELTERASLHDLAGAREKVATLRALGYRIAVDDLGAGYAGLTSLAILQPEIVKLDMELVRGIHASPTKAKLVSAVLTLCRELNAEVIAEGIETVDEFRALDAMGCSLLQGYLFARPSRLPPSILWPASA